MSTRKSIQNKIKCFGITLSLVFGFMLLSGIEANAQWRQDRRDDVRDARQDGYREGLEEGREDAREGRRFDPYSKNDYRRAGGEDSRREQQAFRNRFLQGYRQGYESNRRNVNRNNGYGGYNNRGYNDGYNNGNMRQTAIQTRTINMGGRLYRETYRIVYRPDGTTRTQLVSRVRIR
jgi:flagellar biosynthesis/type III secretory pathway protein FliH